MAQPNQGNMGSNRGQSKLHNVTDAQGNPVNSPSGQSQWTQEEWRQRDKSLGYTRPDSDEDDSEVPSTGSNPGV